MTSATVTVSSGVHSFSYHLGVLKQTSPSSQLHQLSPGDPSVAGEEDNFSLRSRHHYFGAVPLVFWENQERILLHLDQQKFPQRQTGFHCVNPCLGKGIEALIK